jgi:hypothetical protein
MPVQANPQSSQKILQRSGLTLVNAEAAGGDIKSVQKNISVCEDTRKTGLPMPRRIGEKPVYASGYIIG